MHAIPGRLKQNTELSSQSVHLRIGPGYNNSTKHSMTWIFYHCRLPGTEFPLTMHTFCNSCLFFWAEHIVVHSLPLQQKGRAAISNEEGMAYQRHSSRKDPGTQNAHGSVYVNRFPLKSHLYDFCGRIPPRSFMPLISRSIHLLFISIPVTLVEWPPQRQPTVSNHDNSQTGKATP